ncbi:MAG: sulfite exporter TauE/SafE family protein [Acidimicrobiia bacterium]
MDFTWGALLLAALATIFGATIQGAIGFGMNLVTVPVLALLLPESLPLVAVLLGIPISIAMLRHEHHALDRNGLAWIITGRVPGSIIGAWVVATVTVATLQGLIGAFVLVFVGTSLFTPPIPVRSETQLAAGAVSGVTGTAAGIGGPPIALLYQHHSGPAMRSTLAASFFFGTLLSIITLSVARQVGWDQVGLGLGLAPLVVAGSYAGRRFHDFLDRGWMRPAVLVFATISALVVIADALL